MKTQKSCLYAAIFAACIFPQGLYAIMANTLELQGRKEPALVGIDVNNLAVKVVGDVNAAAYAELLRHIESLARNDIRTACAGLPVSSSTRQRVRYEDEPLLCVNVHILDPEASQSIYFVQTRLTRTVRLSDDRSEYFKAVVWETPPAVKMLDRSSLQAAIEKIVSDQAKSFAHSYIMSNPILLSDAGESRTSRDMAEQAEDAQFAFVASKNSKVFHKPSCPFARKIASKNLVGYGSKEEAIAAGKRPCKSCNP